MADPTYKKLSELTELAAHPATADYFPFVDASAGATKRVTLANIDKLGVLELTDPGADRIAFWDDSEGAMKWLTVGDGLTLSTTTLSAGITEGQIADGAVTTAKLDGDAVTGAKIADDAVDSEHIAAGAIDTAHIAANAVDDTKVGNRVPQFYRRQGGSATNWDSNGSTTYTPTTVRMQAGVKISTSSDVTVTFPTAFSYDPIVIASVEKDSVNLLPYVVTIMSITETNFKFICYDMDGNEASGHYIHWLAIGPE